MHNTKVNSRDSTVVIPAKHAQSHEIKPTAKSFRIFGCIPSKAYRKKVLRGIFCRQRRSTPLIEAKGAQIRLFTIPPSGSRNVEK